MTQLAAMADVRLPIRTHPLQALVTNAYAQGFGPIVSDSELLCYVSQTARGQMLMGAEFDSQPSYSMASSFEFLQSVSAKVTHILPFLRDLRVLRQMDRDLRHLAGLLADHGSTGVDGLLVTTGWGTWGSRPSRPAARPWPSSSPPGRRPPCSSFGLDRFARDHAMADQGSAGTR